MEIIKHSQLVAVRIPANNTATNIYLPDVPNLRHVIVTNILAYAADDVALTPEQKAVVQRQIFVSSFLTLQSKNGYFTLEQTPLLKLHPFLAAGAAAAAANFWQMSKSPEIVNFTKSFITLGDLSLFPLAGDQYFLLDVHYRIPN